MNLDLIQINFNPTIVGCAQAARRGLLDVVGQKLEPASKKKTEMCSVVTCTAKVLFSQTGTRSQEIF
jgi:hypothetical protein